MLIEDMLTAEELEAIDEYRRCYAYNSAGYPNNDRFEPSRYILREWAKCKNEYLFKLFGNQLIISKPIQITKNYNELVTEIAKLHTSNSFGRCNRGGKTFYTAFMDFLYPIPGFFNNSYLDYGIDNVVRDKLFYLIDASHLVANEYSGGTFYVNLPNGKKLKVQNGCKVSKVLGKIAEAFNLPGYEDYRICLSQIINQKSVEGKITLSIHPLDYMTMSDNNCGWESCMSWRKEGGYRQGTVEMMNSNHVVVAYISAEEDMRLTDDFYWNSKKWRQLFIVNEDLITSVKGYPNHNSELAFEIMNWLRELAKENLGWNYQEPFKYYHEDSRITIDSFSEEKNNFYIDPTTENMYNDFGSAPFHWLALSDVFNENKITTPTWGEPYFHINYGGQSQCMICGDLYPDFDGEGCLACDCCQTRVYCAFCEEPIEGEIYEVDGHGFCEYCFENHTCSCSCCGEAHCYEDTTVIFIIPRLNKKDNEALAKKYVDSFYIDAQAFYNRDDMMYRLSIENAHAYVCDNNKCFERWVAGNLLEGRRPHKRKFGYCVNWYVYFDELTPEAQEEYCFGYATNEEYKESFSRLIAHPSNFVD